VGGRSGELIGAGEELIEMGGENGCLGRLEESVSAVLNWGREEKTAEEKRPPPVVVPPQNRPAKIVVKLLNSFSGDDSDDYTQSTLSVYANWMEYNYNLYLELRSLPSSPKKEKEMEEVGK